MINLRKLSEQQENQRALKINYRNFKQTHDIKLTESLSPITKKLDEVKETTQKLEEVVEKSQTEDNTPQPAIEYTQPHQPIENIEGVVNDVGLENTLGNMTGNTGYFKTYYDSERGWMWNGYLIKKSSGKEKKLIITNKILFPVYKKY